MTAVSPDAATLWRAVRTPLAIGLVVVAVGIGVAWLTAGDSSGSLHPEDTGPSGSRALARIIQAEGVRVELVESTAEVLRAADDEDTTLLITRPGLLLPSQLSAVADLAAADLVLVAPADAALAELAPALHTTGPELVEDRQPDCDLAGPAGDADLGGFAYGTTDDAERCYDDTLVRVRDAGRTVTVLGSGTPLQNRYLDERGNAALVMRLLGRHDRLVWYVPQPGDPAGADEQRSFGELLPDGWRFGAVQLGVAVVLLALWRARRLGPVVAELLPVVVRGAETVEGLARLYRRAGATDRAADALRRATVSRLSAMLGGGQPDAVVDAVARRTGRQPAQVGWLLYSGGAPPDDAALVRLAAELDALEKEVRRT